MKEWGWNAAGESRGSTALALRALWKSGEVAPFVGEVYLWENSQEAQAGEMSGLFSYSSTKKRKELKPVGLCLRALSLFY